VKTILPVRARILSKLEDKSSSSQAATATFDVTVKKESCLQKSSLSVMEPPSPTNSTNKRIRGADDSITDSESLTASESSISPLLGGSNSLNSLNSSNTSHNNLKGGSVSHNLPISYHQSFSYKPNMMAHHHIPITVMQQPEQIPQIPINPNSTIYYSSATDPTINGSLSSNLSSNEEEFVSSRRRRRLNQIVPNPRKPRQADYNCSVCNEAYSCIVQDNPWWAVYHHECPKCHLIQVPRIDIGLNSNAVENDPNVTALYGEGIDDSGDEGDEDSCSEDGNDNEDEENILVSGDNNTSPNDELAAEDEVDDEKPFDGEGLLGQEEASKLLVLMCHARTCSGHHASPKHAEICRSTKFLMLHIRDCTGRDLHARECKFPWCLPCKKMLRHLTRCYDPANCAVCNPWSLPESYQQLRALNQMSCMPVA
jgi:transcription elongation factor Elf1